MRRLHETRGLCPVCLRRLPAFYEEDGDGAVFFTRTCPEHGTFSVPAWPGRSEAPDIVPFSDWRILKTPSYPERPLTDVREGCPYDCGLCPAHAQHTCHGLIEVTMRCNLACPLCYACSGGDDLPSDPSLEAVYEMLAHLLEVSGTCNVQLSGGEPTLRDDLPQIVSEAKKLGFPLVQVNSNGIRLGQDRDYVRRLADAGLDSVYLQWDSLSDSPTAFLRGTRVPGLRELKERAVANAREAGLGVVLVATVLGGVNDGELGSLLKDAVRRGPHVRGLHLQPASFFGRTPSAVLESPRLTMGQVLQKLAEQAPEWVHATDFHPPHCEHSLCSFSAVYRRTEQGLVLDSAPFLPGDADQAAPIVAAEGSRRAKAFLAGQWSRPEGLAVTSASCCGQSGKNGTCRLPSSAHSAFSRFLAGRSQEQRFTLSGMAFQDALSLDMERLRSCCIHIVRPDGRIVPFCAQNMTSLEGIPLYPGRLDPKKS